MTTIFGNEGNNFYSAFYEPDATKRRAALDAWVESATPAIQAAVSEELKAFVDFVTEGRWTEEGWRGGDAKLHRIQNDYPLVMDITLRKLNLRKKFKGDLPTPVVYKPEPKVVQSAQQNSSPQNSNTEDDNSGDYDDGGRSPNDDRSDSMNPNNDAYQASMDNRSDQMNPNNDAYWSSRGR